MLVITYNPTHLSYFFFFNDTATTEIYTLSLHDALPIYPDRRIAAGPGRPRRRRRGARRLHPGRHLRGVRRLRADRKSTRLNSSHGYISYAVFCLKKKKKENTPARAVLNCIPRHTASWCG